MTVRSERGLQNLARRVRPSDRLRRSTLSSLDKERHGETTPDTTGLRPVSAEGAEIRRALPAVEASDADGFKVVYFIEASNGLIKIGSTKNLSGRSRALAASNALPLRLVAWDHGSKVDELALHRLFAEARRHGEWFSPTPELLRFVREVAHRGRRVVDVAAWQRNLECDQALARMDAHLAARAIGGAP